MQLLRPPPLPPPAVGAPPHPLPRLNADGRRPVVCIKHPGYPPLFDKLISIPAVDPLPSPSSPPSPSAGRVEAAAEVEAEVAVGLHHGTVLTICGIIADNAFDIYLSYDREGHFRLDENWHPDSILPPGEYWAQVPQLSSTSVEPGQHEASEFVSAAQVPATGPAEARDGDENTTSAQRLTPYPIVPNFENWRFPHGKLPALWLRDHEPPSSAPRQGSATSTSLSNSIAQRLRALQPTTRSCAISAHSGGLEMAHIIHSRCKDWFLSNDMTRYSNSTPTLPIDQPFNKIALRADLHALFDSAYLAIIPKPVSISTPPSASTSSTAPASHATRCALAVHVLATPDTQLELIPLYHNQALCFQEIGNEFSRQYRGSREYLFARFAWSIFPLLRTFLENKRLVAVRVKGQQGYISAAAALSSEEPACEYKWESNSSLAALQPSRSTSRKRSASQMSQAQDHAGYDSEIDDELDGPLQRKRRSPSQSVYQLDEESEQFIEWATCRREAAAESDLLPEPSGYIDVVGAEVPRGRRRSRRGHREAISSSNSPRGSMPDLSASFSSNLSACPDDVNDMNNVDDADASGNGISTTEDMPTKDGLSSTRDVVLQEDMNGI